MQSGSLVLTELSAPPKPPLAFRVGVVGHRPNRLNDANLLRLGQVIREILQSVQSEVLSFAEAHAALFAPKPPVLRAISPLAEGTDRLFAEQALDLGWELCCVMPFHQVEFEKDFLPGVALEADSLTRFRGILERAEAAHRLTCFQLDGNRASEGAAYGLGGRVVLNQSDLLVVVWDGVRQGKRGGTEETLNEALRNGVPVIWVDARVPHVWQLIRVNLPLPDKPGGQVISDGSGRLDSVREVVREALAVPEPATSEKKETVAGEKQVETSRLDLEQFYAEARPRRSWAVLWKAFRDVMADSSLPKIDIEVKPFEASVLTEWPQNTETPAMAMVDQLRPFYAWPDKLAVLYADRYRSAFILVFLLSALAVAMALAPIGWPLSSGLHRGGGISTLLELVAIVVILVVVLIGHTRKWHERWIDYRLAAELLRHLRVVAPIAGEHPFPQVPAHHAAHGDPSATWMNWYVRAVARFSGLPNTVVTRTYIRDTLGHLDDLLKGQIAFHEASARRSRTIERRLHAGIVLLLALTGGACVLNLFHVLVPGHVLTFVCGFFPALGAALAGINNQGEFRRVAKRSVAMQANLIRVRQRVTELSDRVEKSNSEESFAAEVAVLSGEVARPLLHEVLDWRIVFLDRPLEVGP